MPRNKKAMQYVTPWRNRIGTRILLMLLVLFFIAAIIISIVNSFIIRMTYQHNFTERALLTNALMANSIHSDDVQFFVDIMSNNLDQDAKQRQVQFYYDRIEYNETPKGSTPSAELVQRMKAFRDEMNALKENNGYWAIIEELVHLTATSNSEYLYVMANTGLKTNDGETLYTFIFANDDALDADVTADGLGTSDTSLDAVLTVYETKKQMEEVAHYNASYGDLYFTYSPIINDEGDVIAFFGSDIAAAGMNRAVMLATLLSNSIVFAVFVVAIIFVFLFLRKSIIAPLNGLTATARELAEGNIYAPTSISTLMQRTEIGTLATAINNMSLIYQGMLQNAANLFADVRIGKLNVRSNISKYKGDLQNFIIQTNETLDATMLFINSVPESIIIMNKNFDIYFRNDNFNRCFENISGLEFISKIFALDFDEELPEKNDELLKKKIGDALAETNFSATVWIKEACFSVLFKEIITNSTSENSVLIIAIDITALIKQKEKAQAAAEAKSSFLSRMSHEMRTPMNAIIGMTKIAQSSGEVAKLKYCLTTINTSANHLLNIINDVLDMSKIEAGKFELETMPINIEKILSNVCNIVIDNIEKKHQKFNVSLSKGLDLNYIGDELRLSQIIINLLSNAIKFTPDGGVITLSVEKVLKQDNANTLRFSVTDTGIGMTKEQISRLFNAFEQADGSVTRKYGGTGLGLTISKNILEKMGGTIWVESTQGVGSSFIFELALERVPHNDTIIFDGIRPEDIKVLIVESDDAMRNYFCRITENFGIRTDSASSINDATKLIDAAKLNIPYDIVFVDCDAANGLDYAKHLNETFEKSSVVIVTSFLEWRYIEKNALECNITRHISKPFFPSSIMDIINETIGNTLKLSNIQIVSSNIFADFSNVNIILAEDVEINREIFMALLEDTHISIDIAINGLEAVEKFRSNPDKYDLIIMDIQMPEMDGLLATRTIRCMDNIPKAKSIPIIAMTANAFKEDVDLCLAAGMNDHLSKPINEKLVMEKIAKYLKLATN